MFVVKEDQTYSEVLKAVRKEITQEIAKSQVVVLHKAENESLEIHIKGDKNAARTLCEAIKERIPTASTRVKRRNMSTIHLSNLDGKTEKAE